MTDTEHTSSRKQPGTRPEDPTDWVALGRRLQNIQNTLVHHESTPRYGDDYYAEALRRLLTDSRCGWISTTEHQWLLDLHTQVDRRNAQEANRRAREARARYATASRTIRAELAGWLRRVTNEQTVPARYRREGVLLAADWLDPAISAAPHASSPASAASSSPQQAAVSPVGSDVLLALRNAGEREGQLAVGWWQQHTLEGRTASEQEHTAQTVLDGIDSSDDAVLAALPRFDVAGYDADRYQAHAPVGAPGWSALPNHDQALVVDAVRDGFTDTVRDGVAARCHAVLTAREGTR
ncbi:hypothetical protein [Micromonospora chersina]|uniref:Uncharacterized protein n=1 Tax=Micromonospora chersina TaxID=47854 RepID=A0A1C6UQP5_9ACTN|nr:hypothetical protein [Micromonospora chersina]SCL56385.1 hypothetical protein GA0070603_2196 [Micromonospora chersina]